MASFSKAISLIKSFAENTSIHALPNIARSEHCLLKFVWSIIFLVALSLATLSITLQFLAYYSFNVYTITQLVEASQVTFPAITLCNLNPFATLNAVEFVSANNTDAATLAQNYYKMALSMSYSKRAQLMNTNVNDSFRQSMGLPLDSFVLMCYYNGNLCNLSVDFAWKFDAQYGNCFTYAADGTKITTKSGKHNGLIVSLFVGLPKSIYTLDLNLGAYVFVHLPNSKPVRGQGIQVPVGFSNSLAISKEVYLRLGEPYTNCVDINNPPKTETNKTLLDAIISFNGIYSQSVCLDYCYQMFIVDQCGCFDANTQPVYQLVAVDEPCSNTSQIQCAYAGFVAFYNSTANDACMIMCPSECERTQFNIQQSLSEYSQNFLDFMTQNVKVASLIQLFNNNSKIDTAATRQSVTTIYLFYDELAYKLYTDVPQTSLLDLGSKVGGVIGLLLGASLISLVDVGFFIIEFLLTLIFKNHNNKLVYKF